MADFAYIYLPINQIITTLSGTMKQKTLWLTILCLLTGVLFVQAQDDSASANTPMIVSTASTDDPGFPPYQKGFYVGLRGGYLLRNKSLSDNPLYHFSNGLFAEVTGGWRNRLFGWDLAVGMLSIKRDHSKAGSFAAAAEDVLKSQDNAGIFRNALDSGQAKGDYFHFPENTESGRSVKDFKGYYALTGPRLWLGSERLQGSVYVQVGVAFRRFGYYYLSGNGASPDHYTYSVNDAATGATIGTADVSVNGSYEQYGMTQTFYDAFKASGQASPENVKEKAGIQFIGRGGASFELFLTPKAALSLGVDYWYIPSPQMTGQSGAQGTLSGPVMLEDPKAAVEIARDINSKYSFTNTYTEKKDLGFLSVSLGVKFWLGNKKPKETAPAPLPPPVLKPAEKSIAVKVIDQPTGKPLADVMVRIEKVGGDEVVETLTMEDGTIPLLSNAAPGTYKITGAKNGINATEARVLPEDFAGNTTVIYRQLIHNDLRFTLAGKTINKETSAPLPFIQTSLSNESKGMAEQQTSDSAGRFHYQLEQHTDYNVIAQHKGYFSNREKVTTKGLNRSEVIYVNLALEVMELKKDASIVLKDIYYDYNKWDIRPDAAVVLDNLVQTLQQNPSVRIELSSHTDSRGGDAFNMTLSRKRAEAAVRYLVSKGITANRLQAKGYGETRLLNNCGNDVPCSEEQHQLNRRTEIKVIE